MGTIRRLAIVDRGASAMRVLAAVADLNGSGKAPPITTIALHADADAQASFVRLADEAGPLDPAAQVGTGDDQHWSRRLDEQSVLDALGRARADAAWVAGGVLAEPAAFAERCEQAGIVVIGPSSATMRVLGDRLALRRVAEQAGVPVIPDSGDRDPGGRHLEVEIIADDRGRTWAVGVRDITTRRQGQPVVEESPSPVLDPATERAVRDAAVRVAAATGYRGAGTVGFRYDPASGQILLAGVDPGSPVERAVIEQTTGLDLVKLQLHVAGGGRLVGRPPRPRGHAIGVWLRAEDPESAFAPAPGRLAVFEPATGPGIRFDSAARPGDMIGPAPDVMVAKIVAWGRDRVEALARLRRALAQTTVVAEGGTTNRSFLLAVLDRAEVRDADLDHGWLDRLIARGKHLPAADPVALLVAAVEAYESDQAIDRAAFHARAARGRAELPAEVGHACLLRYRGFPYRLRVFRTGPRTYRVDAGPQATIAVDRVSAGERVVEVAGRRHRVTTAVDGTTYRIEVDDRAHRITRDDAGIVRSTRPALVVAVCVAPGDPVVPGDPLVVVESMKMESTITAPFGGDVAEIEVGANTQVDAGAPLLRIRVRATADVVAGPAGALDLSGLAAVEPADATPCEQVYDALRSYLLGYDLDAGALRDLLTRQRRLGEVSPAADPTLRRCEDGLLDLFADIGSLYRPRAENEFDESFAAGSTQEYLLSYLQWLDPTRAGLPDRYRERLEQALRRYGVADLSRTPALEEAVVWMFRSFGRVKELVAAITGILDRRLRQPAALATATDLDARARLDRLIAATQGRHQTVADLARDVRFTHLDEPLLEAAGRDEYARVDRHLDALTAEPARADRRERIGRLVASPQPLRSTLLSRWLAETDERFRGVLLEVYIRRYYRIRDLRNVSGSRQRGHLLGTADYELDGRWVHLVVAYVALPKLTSLAKAVGAHLAGVDPGGDVVVDVVAWRDGAALAGDQVATEVARLVRGCDFGRPLRRLDVTVTSTEPAAPEHLRTRHVTFRQAPDGAWAEQRLYRDLHPMLAKRLDLWHLANFELERLASAEDVYLFHGVARDNPSDHRLFALAEVRDLTAVPGTPGAAGPATFPQLEFMGLRALSAMRQALASFSSDRDRPTSNRLVLYVRPPWTIPVDAWPALARSLAPLSLGANLEKVVLQVRIPEPGGASRDAALHVEGLGRRGLTVRELPVGSDPIRPLTAYRQKVLRAERLGAPYPYEVVRMLTPPPGAVARFPTGHFVEHDLDDAGRLVPAARPPGHNTANIVAGLITNNTVKVPEGMTRVALLGDPIHGLGNLAEPECRRIIAAIDLAERLALPLEWFALSSGARIAMDSGTENMDWIAAVLRRLIEFTQGGGEVNIVVTGVNVGAQPYWNAEATMLMHTRGVLIMTPQSAMVLTGKQALDLSGGVSAEENSGIGGFDRIMGPNGQGQYWASTLEAACEILLAHYDHTYVVPGERYPRRAATTDPVDRDVRTAPHPTVAGSDLAIVGDLFSTELNPNRKKPFNIRAIMRAVSDLDARPLERWGFWRGAETVVVWDAHIGGFPVCLLGVESQTINRRGFVAADGPLSWTSGTLFPQSSRKLARAINAASGNRPVVMLANLSGFDGSPESMRHWQLEYGGEIGRAVTNFRGPIVFVVISRYHGGAFVVFSKRLNEQLEIAAVEGSYASVIGGAPAAATVFAREVKTRTEQDPRVVSLQAKVDDRPADPQTPEPDRRQRQARRAEIVAGVRSEKLGEVAAEFDKVHTIQRAQAVGSVDRIIAARDLRPYLIDAVRRGMARDDAATVMAAGAGVAPIRSPGDGSATNAEARPRPVPPDPPRRPAAASAPRRRP